MRILTFLLSSWLLGVSGLQAQDTYSFEPGNPVTAPWIQEHLTDRPTRLMLTPEVERRLEAGIQKDELLPETAQLTWTALKEKGLQPSFPEEKNVVSLSPPPLEYDKNIENLTRLEGIVDPAAFSNGQGEIVVELSGITDQ